MAATLFKSDEPKMTTTALAPWFGSIMPNRTNPMTTTDPLPRLTAHWCGFLDWITSRFGGKLTIDDQTEIAYEAQGFSKASPPASWKERLTSSDPAGWYECETNFRGRTVKRAYWWNGIELRGYEGGHFLCEMKLHTNFRGPLVTSNSHNQL